MRRYVEDLPKIDPPIKRNFGKINLRRGELVMKRKRYSRYSVEQITATLKQHELGLTAAEIVRRLGISKQTFYKWKKQCAIQNVRQSLSSVPLSPS